jgi:hypothetical protein
MLRLRDQLLTEGDGHPPPDSPWALAAPDGIQESHSSPDVERWTWHRASHATDRTDGQGDSLGYQSHLPATIDP